MAHQADNADEPEQGARADAGVRPELGIERREGESDESFAARIAEAVKANIFAGVEPNQQDHEQILVMTPKQRAALREKKMPADAFTPADPDDPDGYWFVPAHIVDAAAMRMWEDQWNTQVVACDIVVDRRIDKTHMIGAKATVRVTVRAREGDATQFHEATAMSVADARADDPLELVAAYNKAAQGAVTKARKAAIQLFSEAFGGIAVRDYEREGVLEKMRERRRGGDPEKAPARKSPEPDAKPTRDAGRQEPIRSSAGVKAGKGKRNEYLTLRDLNGKERYSCAPGAFPKRLDEEIERTCKTLDDLKALEAANRPSLDALPLDVAQACQKTLDDRYFDLHAAPAAGPAPEPAAPDAPDGDAPKARWEDDGGAPPEPSHEAAAPPAAAPESPDAGPAPEAPTEEAAPTTDDAGGQAPDARADADAPSDAEARNETNDQHDENAPANADANDQAEAPRRARLTTKSPWDGETPPDVAVEWAGKKVANTKAVINRLTCVFRHAPTETAIDRVLEAQKIVLDALPSISRDYVVETAERRRAALLDLEEQAPNDHLDDGGYGQGGDEPPADAAE